MSTCEPSLWNENCIYSTDEILKDELKDGLNRCGEVFYTTIGYLLFRCTFCKSTKPTNIKEFCEHLSSEHKDFITENKSTVKPHKYIKIADLREETFAEEIDIAEQYDFGELNNYDEDDSLAEPFLNLEQEVPISTVLSESFGNKTKEVSTNDNISQKRKLKTKPHYLKDIENKSAANPNKYMKIANLEEETSAGEVEYDFAESNNTVVDDSLAEPLLNLEGGVITAEDSEEKSNAAVLSESSGNKTNEVPSNESTSQDRKLKTKQHYLLNVDSAVQEKNAERKYECDICHFRCTDRSNMLAHKRRHTGEKNHQCPQCPKKFYTSTELNTHVRFHTRERPYMCSTCGRGFFTSSAMLCHTRRHTNVRPYKCDYCDKRFYEKTRLKEHLTSHTKQKREICSICSSSFATVKNLKVHLKVHENKRQYVCYICGAAYNQYPALSSHMKKHGEKLHRVNIKKNEDKW